MTIKRFAGILLLIGTAVLFWYLGNNQGREAAVSVPHKAGSKTSQPLSPPVVGPPPEGRNRQPAPAGSGTTTQDIAQRFLESQAQNRDALMVPFGRLMEELGFDKGQRERALNVLKEHQALVDEQMAVALSSGGRPPSLAKLQEQDRARDVKLRAALGDQAFEQYQKNLDTIPERMALSSLEDRLDRAGVPLTDQQAGQILTSMVQTARDIQGPLPTAPPEASKFTGGIPASPIQKVQRADPGQRFENVSSALTQSASNLSPDQPALVNQFITDTKEMRRQMSSHDSPFGR